MKERILELMRLRIVNGLLSLIEALQSKIIGGEIRICRGTVRRNVHGQRVELCRFLILAAFGVCGIAKG